MKKLMGGNEYRHIIYQEMRKVCAYERDQGYILLDLNFNELVGKVSFYLLVIFRDFLEIKSNYKRCVDNG